MTSVRAPTQNGTEILQPVMPGRWDGIGGGNRIEYTSYTITDLDPIFASWLAKVGVKLLVDQWNDLGCGGGWRWSLIAEQSLS